MVFLKGLFRKNKGAEDAKRKSSFSDITKDVDPMTSWDIISELGDGAFGKVYKTKHKESELLSALKKVEFESEAELDDFMLEIEILTQFKHPNVLSLLEVYLYQSKLWLFLELCSGGALDSIMDNLDKPLTEPQIRFVSREVLSGLQFLHENLIVHRDMKAGNILLTATNEIRIADFGVSARLTNAKQMLNTLTGTPYWMAPEVIACESLNGSSYNWKADIWSFGITLIELAQMKPPHNETNPSRVLIRIAKSDPPTLSRPRCWSSQFSAILATCLQKDPNSRPECSELLKHPFIADVTEADRKHIELLVCESKAEVIDMMEDVDPNDIPDDMEVESDEAVLILPDSTKIEIPAELDEDEDDTGPEVGSIDTASSQPEETFVVISANSEPALVDQLIEELANQLIEDVITSENRHPSVASCLFELMRELNEQATREPSPRVSPAADEQRLPGPKPVTQLLSRRSFYRSLTRTRRFVVDGKEITSTTKRIVRANPAERRLHDEEINQRKAELRAFRMLGKQEAHQVRELAIRIEQLKEQIDNKMTAEFWVMKRGYEQKIEAVSRNFRTQLDRLEKEHDAQVKQLRAQMAKEEQAFKDRVRSELGHLSRSERKAALRELQSDQFPASGSIISRSVSNLSSTGSVISDRLMTFREQQSNLFKDRLHQFVVQYFTRKNDIRRAEVAEKQSLRMAFEQDKWKLDQRQLRVRHQLARSQLRDFFVIKRQKLAGLLDLELNELRQRIAQERTALGTAHAIERKNHAKRTKLVYKANLAQVHRQRRSTFMGSANQLRDQPRVDEEVRRRLEEEIQDLEKRQLNQQNLLEQSIASRLKELELAHATRRNELVDLESERLHDLDDRYEYDLRLYLEAFPRNQTLLLSQFAKELDQVTEPIPQMEAIKRSGLHAVNPRQQSHASGNPSSPSHLAMSSITESEY